MTRLPFDAAMRIRQSSNSSPRLWYRGQRVAFVHWQYGPEELYHEACERLREDLDLLAALRASRPQDDGEWPELDALLREEVTP